MDVDLKYCSPLELAKKIRNMYKSTPIFFVSFDPMKKKDISEDIHCWSYITNFFTIIGGRKNLSKLYNDSPRIIFKKKDFSYIVRADEIVYIESKRKSINIFTVDEEIFLPSYMFTLEKLLNKLNNLTKDFVRCHKGYIININYIEKFNNDTIKLINVDESIPIGDKYKESFKNTIAAANYVIKQTF